MSKLFALACTGVVHAAAVAIREHGHTADPHALLENLRMLAKERVEKKINASTLIAVAELVHQMEEQVNESLAQCAAAEDTLCVNTRRTLTDLNDKLSQDTNEVSQQQSAIVGDIADEISDGRDSEQQSHERRFNSCASVCNTMVSNPPCTVPADGGWLDDDEPCCDQDVDASLVPDTPKRSGEWKELEDYMECLNVFITGNETVDPSPYDDYEYFAADCVNHSETWSTQKTQNDPVNDGVKDAMCDMIDNDVKKCTDYATNWAAATSTHNSQIDASKIIIENGLQQYEAMRKITCLFDAIKNETLTGEEIAAACQECEDAAPLCQAWCPAVQATELSEALTLESPWDNCPVGLRAPTCCVEAPAPNACDQRHPCDLCTNAFRHEFYDCPADGCSSSPGVGDVDGESLEPMCTLLIQQFGCGGGFDCETECKDLADTGCGKGSITDTLLNGTKVCRVAYNEFVCAVTGNSDFDN